MFSVLVATYNRCASLKKLLESLSKQTSLPPGVDCEIIVVDNGSTDGTRAEVDSWREQFGKKLKYFFEPVRGRSHALNRGIRESSGKVLLFTDDDVIVGREWIFYIHESFSKYPVDAVGGRILPVFPKSTPRWVRDNADLLQGVVVWHDYGEDIKYYDNLMVPFVGANMAIRRELWDGRKLFVCELGVGTGRVGEDTELFRRLKDEDKRILYCGKALVWHPVGERRMTLGYIARWHMAHGRYCTVMEIKRKGPGIVCHLKMFCYLALDSVRRILGLVFIISKWRAFLRHWSVFFNNIGMAAEYAIHFRRRVRR